MLDNFLGQVRLSQGDNDAAARLFTDGLAVARRAQDGIPILISLYDLALSSQAQGDLAGAAGHLKEGLAIAAEIGDETSAAYYLEALAAVAEPAGQPAACRAPACRRALATGSQRQRLAARLRATRPARRCRLGRAARPPRRRGIRGGPGLGPIHRKQARQAVRPGITMTRGWDAFSWTH